MAAIDQYIERIPNHELQEQIREEVARLTKKKRFGLVYENHLPDNVIMPEVTIRRGTKVTLRGNTCTKCKNLRATMLCAGIFFLLRTRFFAWRLGGCGTVWRCGMSQMLLHLD